MGYTILLPKVSNSNISDFNKIRSLGATSSHSSQFPFRRYTPVGLLAVNYLGIFSINSGIHRVL